MRSLFKIVLFIGFSLLVQNASGQSRAENILPEYKIRYYDTTGTYIQIINYFDRTYYIRAIYLRKEIDKEQSQYFKVKIDTATGIGSLGDLEWQNMHLQIGQSLEIRNVALKANALNKIEIRSEEGFISIGLKSGRNRSRSITGWLTNAFDTTQREKVSLPLKMKLKQGKYYLNLETIPKVSKTLYIKPSKLIFFELHRPIPFHINNKKRYAEFELQYAYYPYKKYRTCLSGSLINAPSALALLPKRMYAMRYRKRGRRRFRKKKFYMDNSMELFNITLD